MCRLPFKENTVELSESYTMALKRFHPLERSFEKKPDKTSNDIALNNILMVGPTIQEDLIAILIRFRSHIYAFIADIAKMYRQIALHPDDRKFHKILWRDDTKNQIKTYNLNTVTYGVSSSSFLVIRTLKQLSRDGGRILSAGEFHIKRRFLCR